MDRGMKSTANRPVWLTAAFSAAGALAGYLYYFFVGCASGTCVITSNPYISTIYGGVLGFLIGRIVTANQKKPEEKSNE